MSTRKSGFSGTGLGQHGFVHEFGNYMFLLSVCLPTRIWELNCAGEFQTAVVSQPRPPEQDLKDGRVRVILGLMPDARLCCLKPPVQARDVGPLAPFLPEMGMTGDAPGHLHGREMVQISRRSRFHLWAID